MPSSNYSATVPRFFCITDLSTSRQKYIVSVYAGVLDVTAYQPFIADHWRLLVLIGQACLHRSFDLVVAVDSAHVYCLSHVEALRKAAVVGTKQRQNILLRPLVSLIHLDSMFDEFDGVDHECDAIEELSFASFLENVVIEGSLIRFRDHIPSFNCTFVAVV